MEELGAGLAVFQPPCGAERRYMFFLRVSAQADADADALRSTSVPKILEVHTLQTHSVFDVCRSLPSKVPTRHHRARDGAFFADRLQILQNLA